MTTSLTFATNNGDVGGGEVMLFELAEAARALEHRVTIVGPSHPREVVAQAIERGFETIEITARTRPQYLRGLRRWDAAERRGVLWCNGLVPALATAGHADRIVHLHRMPSPRQLPAARLARLGARATVVPSRFLADRFPGAEVLPNWTEPIPDPGRREPGSGPIRVGFLGRLAVEKGILEYARAVRLLQRANPGRYLAYVGGVSRFTDSAEERLVETELAELDQIERPGWVPPADFFAAVDVLVAPSRAEESFGLVVAEALGHGVPVIVSDAGALPEVAGPNHPYVVPAGDPERLAAAIAEAAHQPTDPAGRARWEHLYSPEAGRARFADLLSRVLPAPIAIAHDYLTQRGGAERVALTLAEAFPGAPLYTTLYEPADTFPEFGDIDVRPSWLNRFGPLRRNYRAALPLLALAAATHRIDAEVVIASTSAWSHGFPTRGRRIAYCHSPARFLYLSEEYLGGPLHRSPKGWLLAALRPGLRRWDQRAAGRVDTYLANSTVVRERIERFYHRPATVVPAPHSIDPTGPQEPIDAIEPGYFLVVSRLLPYKNVQVIIDAFRQLPAERLVVVGTGPYETTLRRDLPGNVTLAGRVGDEQLRWLYAHAEALIAMSFEDYGLTPLEAASFGRPTIALRAGGFLDTIEEGSTGVFCDVATAESVVRGIHTSRETPWSPARIMHHAQSFDRAHFLEHVRTLLEGDHEQHPTADG